MKDKMLQKIASADLTQYSETLAEVSLQEAERKQVTEAFEAAVKGVSMKITEELIEEMEAEFATSKIELETDLTEKAEKYGEYLKEQYAEDIDTYLNHISETWLQENKLAVTSGIKESMFDSLMAEFKTMFVEHNIYVPEDKVDVVSELEEQLTEYTAELDKTIRSNKNLSERVNELEKVNVISERTIKMTDSQRERVETLSENLDFTDSDFNKQLDTILSMVSISEKDQKGKFNFGKKDPAEIENKDKNKDKKTVTESNLMGSYLKAAQRLR